MLSFGFSSPTFVVSNWRFSPPQVFSSFKIKSKRKPKDKAKTKAKESAMEWMGAINGLSCGLNLGAARMTPLGSIVNIGGGCLGNYLFTNAFFPNYSPRFRTFAVPCLAGFCARKALVPFPRMSVLCDRLSRYIVVGGTALNLGMCVKKRGRLTGFFAAILYYLFTHTPATSHRNIIVSWTGIIAGAAVYLHSSPKEGARRIFNTVATSCAVCVGVERAVVRMRKSSRFKGFFESFDRSIHEISESFEDPLEDVDPYPYYFAVPPMHFYAFPYDPFSYFYF